MHCADYLLLPHAIREYNNIYNMFIKQHRVTFMRGVGNYIIYRFFSR